MLYEQYYSNSWALLVGINDYHHAPPLAHACNDAEGVRDTLVNTFHFSEDNTTLLLNEDATRTSIMQEYLALANRVEPNDRVVIFFAGHGNTLKNPRGETGFLLPADGALDDLSTLIRWDDLTRNADLIAAKHMLFIMDACYGGLAVNRFVPPGSMRFLRDMLTRYSRQVLAAGKANQVVSDSGGPREGHSIFTGHLLDAFEGAASKQENVLTAAGVIADVYDRVAKDQDSKQTPHYGSFAGDGDMVFLPEMPIQQSESKADNTLVEIPSTLMVPEHQEQGGPVEARVKQYLLDSRFRIALDDLVTSTLRETLHKLGPSGFPLQNTALTGESFVERLQKYESCVTEIRLIVALICRWGVDEHKPTLQQILARIGEAIEMEGGQTVWLGLRWYPVKVLLYTGGISALSAQNYANLYSLLNVQIQDPRNSSAHTPLIIPMVDESIPVARTGIWKHVPGHERHYVPESEYAFNETQPKVEDLFFLGKSYEDQFDRFEMLMSLTYAHRTWKQDDGLGVWGPAGRFWWKFRSHRVTSDPFSQLRQEAASMTDSWEPLKAGFFGGSYKRFEALVDDYEKMLRGQNWML